MQRPLIYILLAYLSGIVWGYYSSLDRLMLLLLSITLLLFAVTTLLLRRKLYTLILSLSAFTLIGNLFITSTLSPRLPPNHISHYVTKKPVVLQGILWKSPQVFSDKTRYSVLATKIIEKTGEISVSGKLLLTDYHSAENLRYGDVVRFSSRIRRPNNFNNPGSFDYARFLAFQGIFVTASLDATHRIVKVGESDCNPFLSRIEQCREAVRQFFTSELSSPAGEIATALIIGDQSGIAEEMHNQFAITGVAHILAISGLNIGIIALISMFCIKTLCRCSTWLLLATDLSKVAALITLVPVMVYCLIAGGGLATVRATVMVIIYLLAIIINRQDDIWNTLGTAAFLILLCSPSSLFDCSFQLSFVSVAAIVYLNPRLSITFFEHSGDSPPGRRSWLKVIARQIMTLLTVTLAATLGTAPLVAFYFNRCSPWGIPSNLLVVPLIGFLVVPLGLLASCLLFCAKPLAVFSTHIMEVVLNLSNAIVAFFAKMPYADFRTTTPTLLELVLYYSGLILLINSRRSWGARYGLAAVSIVFIINSCCWYYHSNLNPRLRITAIDVGQGEATLVQFPGGTTMLIDGGGFYGSSFDTGGVVVAPLLWSKKIRHIDILVLSHPHPDHLNGLVFIVRHFTIGEVWTNGELIATDTFKTFEQMIATRSIKKRVVGRNHPQHNINGVVIEFLHPDQQYRSKLIKNPHDRLNNNSLVIRLIYNKVSILFTGDIYSAAEREIIDAFPALESTMLKIPHHGSGTSSSKPFLEMLKPRIALLSVGRDNSFHLPHPAVIKRYEDVGCCILRTDEDGAVSLETDGLSLRVRTHLQKSGIEGFIAGR